MVDAPLEVVYIYFGTETYDEYERDVKVVLETTVDEDGCVHVDV